MRTTAAKGNYLCVTFYRRRLPHLFHIGHPAFVTWRLHGSLPAHRVFPVKSLTSGQAFAALDRLLDEARTGPFYLSQPAIAEIVVDAIHYNAERLGHYVCHGFVVMPNHVHLLITPAVPLPQLTKSLKSITAKRANLILGLSGNPSWQEESYDHLVRNALEFDKILNYIEENPVRAGLVKVANEYLWSSLNSATGGSPAVQGDRPTTG